MSARPLLLITAVVVVAAVSSCSAGGGGQAAAGSPSAQASASATAGGHDKLDPAFPTPAGFPADVPVYPGSRLTAGAVFTASGQVTYGMEWETLDSVDKVHTFYATKLSQGDWTVSFSGATASGFAANFSRKSNSKVLGIVGADGSSGVTKISLSLVASG